MPSEPRVPLPMSSFSRRSSNVTLSVSPTLSQSSVANALGSQIHLQRPKKLPLEASSTGSRRHSSSYSSVRRWHSVRCSGTRTQSFASLNGANYSPSLRSRRVSSSAVLEKGLESELGSYDKYKISRANPDSLINLVIEDSISPGESKSQWPHHKLACVFALFLCRPHPFVFQMFIESLSWESLGVVNRLLYLHSKANWKSREVAIRVVAAVTHPSLEVLTDGTARRALCCTLAKWRSAQDSRWIGPICPFTSQMRTLSCILCQTGV